MTIEQKSRASRVGEVKESSQGLRKPKRVTVESYVDYYLHHPGYPPLESIAVASSHEQSSLLVDNAPTLGQGRDLVLIDACPRNLEDILSGGFILDENKIDQPIPSPIRKQSESFASSCYESLHRIDDSVQKLLQQSRDKIQRQLSEANARRASLRSKLSNGSGIEDGSVSSFDVSEHMEYLVNTIFHPPSRLSGKCQEMEIDETFDESTYIGLHGEISMASDSNALASERLDEIGAVRTSLQLEMTSPIRNRKNSKFRNDNGQSSVEKGRTPMRTPGQPFSLLLGSPLASFSPMQLSTQRNKLKSPNKLRINDPEIIAESSMDEEEKNKERERCMNEISHIAMEHRLLRSFEDIRLVPKKEAYCDDAQIEHHMQRLLNQQRTRNNDLDSSIQTTLDLLNEAQSITSPTSENADMGFNMSIMTEEGWGRYQSGDSMMRSSLLGRGKFGSVHAAQMKLRDAPLMQSVIKTQSTKQTSYEPSDTQSTHRSQLPAMRSLSQPNIQSFLMSPTAALLKSATKSNRTSLFPPILQLPVAAQIASDSKHSSSAVIDLDHLNIASPQASEFASPNASKSKVYSQRFIYIKDMLENPFTPRQAALIPKAKLVAIKIAQYATNYASPSATSSRTTREYPPLACISEYLREIKVRERSYRARYLSVNIDIIIMDFLGDDLSQSSEHSPLRGCLREASGYSCRADQRIRPRNLHQRYLLAKQNERLSPSPAPC